MVMPAGGVPDGRADSLNIALSSPAAACPEDELAVWSSAGVADWTCPEDAAVLLPEEPEAPESVEVHPAASNTAARRTDVITNNIRGFFMRYSFLIFLDFFFKMIEEIIFASGMIADCFIFEIYGR
jgi:hypothetical protein